MKRKSLFYLIVLLLCCNQMLKAQLETSKLVITDGIRNENLKRTIEKNVSDFLYACNSAVINGKKPDLDKKTTTEDARKRFLSIWNTSPMACHVSTLERICIMRPGGGYQIRSIPVTMYEAPIDDQDQEIVINLAVDGRIDDIFVPVSQYADLLNANLEEEDLGLRMVVLDFVDNFKTAYNRKDIKFLETLFSENAVIIVGKEIRQMPKEHTPNVLPGSRIEYVVKNKAEYISSLTSVFKRNKYINVKFEDIEVIRHPNPRYPVYGVTLKQDWRSGNNTASDYMDTGFVFLLIDFSDEKQPVITVRTWQPDKYSDGRALRRDEIFQMGDFIK